MNVRPSTNEITPAESDGEEYVIDLESSEARQLCALAVERGVIVQNLPHLLIGEYLNTCGRFRRSRREMQARPGHRRR